MTKNELLERVIRAVLDFTQSNSDDGKFCVQTVMDAIETLHDAEVGVFEATIKTIAGDWKNG